jgi:hypothetical protein
MEDRLLAQAADDALTRAQELSMMATGEPLEPRLELGAATLPISSVPTLAAAARVAAPGRSSALAGGRPGRPAGEGAAEPRYALKGLMVPLLVLAAILVTMASTDGDGTRGVLALGAVVIAVLIVLIPVLGRRQRPTVEPAAVKGVIDVMAGVILALRPAGADDPAADGAGGRPGDGGAPSR